MRGLVTVAHRIDRPWLDNVKRCNNAASAEFSKSYFLKRDVETHESHFSRTVAHRRWSFPCFSRVSWKQPATVQNHIKKIKKIQHCLATDKTLACLAVQKKKKKRMAFRTRFLHFFLSMQNSLAWCLVVGSCQSIGHVVARFAIFNRSGWFLGFLGGCFLVLKIPQRTSQVHPSLFFFHTMEVKDNAKFTNTITKSSFAFCKNFNFG